jgi:hypothetical protein
VNECLLSNPPCPLYLCENTIGGYKCDGVSGDPANLPTRVRPVEERCPTGFKTGLNEECDGKCLLPNPLPPIIYVCENTIGGYKCD